jgi:YidC/Oxa1 family membrane protein insertase
MEKRVFLTIAMCIAILFGWYFVQAKFFPPATPPAPPPVAAPTPSPNPSAPTATGAQPTTPNAPKPPEQRETVQRDGLYRAVFSSWGAAPVEFTLLNKQYKVSVDGKEVPIDLVHGAPPFTVAWKGQGADNERSDFDLPADAAWTLVRKSDTELVYGTDVGNVHVEKKWELPATGYRLELTVTVENRAQAGDAAAKPVTQHLITEVSGWQDPTVKPGGFLSFGKRDFHTKEGACNIAGKVERLNLENSISKPFGGVGDVKWVSVGEQYFISALAFAPDPEGRACVVQGQADGRIDARTIFASKKIDPGQKVEYQMAAFAGPKQLDLLDAVTVGGVDADLGRAVNYTLEWIARPMFWVLKKIQRVTVNWGVAIIVITILLKLVLFYPNQRSMRSAKKMARLKPEIDKLKEKFGDDKQGMYLAQQKLFKDNGVSMFGGCLPMALQMPIYFAFYSMLGNAVELYRASFVGPIDDMTGPFAPLAIATGALMFIQQKISPTSPDGQQQKMMMYLMPIMFMVFTLFLPSGLTLYILTNTLLTMAQQWWVNRTEPRTTPTAPQGKPKPSPRAKPARA